MVAARTCLLFSFPYSLFFSSSSALVTMTGVVVTTTSLALCVPLVMIFNKYVPQLVGKPMVNGPLIKNLVEAKTKRVVEGIPI